MWRATSGSAADGKQTNSTAVTGSTKSLVDHPGSSGGQTISVSHTCSVREPVLRRLSAHGIGRYQQRPLSQGPQSRGRRKGGRVPVGVPSSRRKLGSFGGQGRKLAVHTETRTNGSRPNQHARYEKCKHDTAPHAFSSWTKLHKKTTHTSLLVKKAKGTKRSGNYVQTAKDKSDQWSQDQIIPNQFTEFVK